MINNFHLVTSLFRILDLSLLTWGLGNLSVLIWNWVILQVYVLMLYPIFSAFISNQLSNMKIPFALWGVVYLVYIGYLLYFPVAAIIEDRLPPIACVILASEQVSVYFYIITTTVDFKNHLRKFC